jgi:ParB family transcriptional regulator, chromosome partitioning protein
MNLSFGAAADALRGAVQPLTETAPPGGKIENGTLFLREDVLDDNPFPHRSGKTDEEYEKVESSVLAIGQQSAILVRKHPTIEGRYQTCFGQTRTEIIRANELIWVKADIAELSDRQMIEIAFAENHGRNALNPLDTVDGLLSIMECQGVHRGEVPAIAASLTRKGADSPKAQAVADTLQSHGVSLSRFRKWLQILKKPEDVLAAIRSGLPFTLGLVIARVPEFTDRATLISQAMAGGITAQGVQDWINNLKPQPTRSASEATEARFKQSLKRLSTADPSALDRINGLLAQIEILLGD